MTLKNLISRFKKPNEQQTFPVSENPTAAQESVTNSQEQAPTSKKNKISKNKILAIMVVLLIFVASYLALILLSQDEDDKSLVGSTPTENSHPSPVSNNPSELSGKIDNHIKSLESLGKFSQNLKPPNIETELEF